MPLRFLSPFVVSSSLLLFVAHSPDGVDAKVIPIPNGPSTGGKAIFPPKMCGNFSLAEMEEFAYRSHDGALKDVLISVEGAESGGFGSVFIGYSEQLQRCVAIKLFHSEEEGQLLNYVMIMEKVDALANRGHIIRFFDHGQFLLDTSITSISRPVLLLEMGSDSFAKRIRSAKAAANDLEMEPIVRELVQPVRELHQVAIHLDLKPQNYVFVRDNNSEEVLKLIDFDGAVLIPRVGQTASEETPADYSAPNSKLATYLYRSPEMANKYISTKADIWSVGITLLEVLTRKSMLEIYNLARLYGSSNFYFPINDSAWDFVDRHRLPIEDLLRLWDTFPRTAMLFTNLLHREPKRRMTANGILAYLEGKCAPPDFERATIFRETSFEQLGLQIEERLAHSMGGDEQLERMFLLRELFRKALERRNSLARKLAQLKIRRKVLGLLVPVQFEEICDTKTTAIGASEPKMRVLMADALVPNPQFRRFKR